MKLIGSLASPYVRKVRVVMAEKKLDYKLELDDVWSPGSKIAASNPLGKVPCLLMDEAGTLEGAVFDSRVIVEYLDTLTPVGKLIPASGRERVEIKTWEALADGICDAAILARLETVGPFRTDAQRCQTWIDRQLNKIHEGLKSASSGLGERPFCGGLHYTLADISVGVTLAYLDFRFPQINWRAAHPNLAKLYEKLSARASFIDTAPPSA